MAQSFMNAERSVLLVAVLFVVRSGGQTDEKNVTTESNTTVSDTGDGGVNRTTISTNDTTTEAEGISTTKRRNTTTTSRRSTKDSSITDERISLPTISIPPLPEGVAVPPAAMMVIAGITCGVIIGTFIVCYIATMMNLCFCKFLMHECPTGRFKDVEGKSIAKDEKAAKKKEEKAAKEEAKAAKKKEGKAAKEEEKAAKEEEKAAKEEEKAAKEEEKAAKEDDRAAKKKERKAATDEAAKKKGKVATEEEQPPEPSTSP